MGGSRLGQALRRPGLLEGNRRERGRGEEKREMVPQIQKVENRRNWKEVKRR